MAAPKLESLFAGVVLGLALFALLACAPDGRLKDRYLPEQFAAAGPQ